MLKLVKINSNKFVVVETNKRISGNREEAIEYLGLIGVRPNTITEVLEIMDEDDRNLADFGINMYWTYVTKVDVDDFNTSNS